VFCKFCGHQISETATFCEACGKAQPANEAPKQKRKIHWVIWIVLALAVIGALARIASLTENTSQHARASNTAGTTPTNRSVLDDPQTYYRMCGPPDFDERGLNVDKKIVMRVMTYKKYGMSLDFAAKTNESGRTYDEWNLFRASEYPSGDAFLPERTRDAIIMRMPCLTKLF
jgi:zinc ribbon protein